MRRCIGGLSPDRMARNLFSQPPMLLPTRPIPHSLLRPRYLKFASSRSAQRATDYPHSTDRLLENFKYLWLDVRERVRATARDRDSHGSGSRFQDGAAIVSAKGRLV